MQVRVWVGRTVAIAISGLIVLLATAHAHAQTDVFFDVSVRGSGVATIHAHIYNNSAASNGGTLLAVPGMTESASTYKPLAQTIFADSRLKRLVRRVIALDFIAHGDSSNPTGLPSGTKFGDLTVEDDVSTLIQAIKALRSRGLGASLIIAHSMGGLVVQGAQESLLAQRSSLSALGIRSAILLAPVPCAESPFNLSLNADLSPFIVNDTVLGSYLSLPPAAWQAVGGFTTKAGTLVPNAPTLATITAEEYPAIEPITTLLQVVGLIPVPRPSVRRGAFALQNGTLLAIISYSQDVLVPADDLDDLYLYLVGRNDFLYRPVVTADAVHSMNISNPAGLLAAIRDMM